jgi:hypothetical protein
MKIKRYDSCVIVYPYKNDTFHNVTVYKKKNNLFSGVSPATVSWCTFGAVTPARAVLYAKAIIKAAQIAEKQNESIKTRSSI